MEVTSSKCLSRWLILLAVLLSCCISPAAVLGREVIYLDRPECEAQLHFSRRQVELTNSQKAVLGRFARVALQGKLALGISIADETWDGPHLTAKRRAVLLSYLGQFRRQGLELKIVRPPADDFNPDIAISTCF